jgi:hypothetical protein
MGRHQPEHRLPLQGARRTPAASQLYGIRLFRSALPEVFGARNPFLSESCHTASTEAFKRIPYYRRRASVLDPWIPYLLRRWNEGCRSAKRLHQEIRERGYRHSVDTVNRLLSSFRYTEGRLKKPSHAPRAKRGSIAGASDRQKRRGPVHAQGGDAERGAE